MIRSLAVAAGRAGSPTLSRAERWALMLLLLHASGFTNARAGGKRARVAVARKLAVIMHRMWLDGTTFDWREHEKAAA